MKNCQRWVTLGFIGCAIVAYLVFSRVAELVWDLGRWAYPDGWPLTPPECIGMALGVILFVVLRKNSRSNGFMNEVAAELVKVTYPQRKETSLATVVVVVFVGFCSLILSLYDMVWGWAVKLLY